MCFAATAGRIAPETAGKLPGRFFPSSGFEDLPNGIAAISAVPASHWAQVAAHFGLRELSGGSGKEADDAPGVLGLAMVAIIGVSLHSPRMNALQPGDDAIWQALEAKVARRRAWRAAQAAA